MLQYVIFPKKKTFINEVKALNKGEIADSQLIWKAFQGANSQQNISYFCLQIFQNVLHSQKKNYLTHNQQRLYATLLCMQILRNKKQKTPQVIQQCRSFIQKLKPCHGKTLLQFLFRQNQDHGYIQFFMSSLAMLPISIDEAQDIGSQISLQLKHLQQFKQKAKNYTQKAHETLKIESFPKNYISQTKILSFGYFCLTQLIKKNNNMLKRKQWQHLRNVLKYLLDGAKSVDVKQYLLKYIHLTIKLITFYGCFQQDIIKDLIIWADKLKEFPGFIGDLGNELFNVLFQQLRLPGSVFRKKLRKDFLSLDTKDSLSINKQFYLITDNEDLYNRNQYLSLILLRKMFIIHVLKIAGISQKSIQQFKSFLKYLNQSSTFILYEKITKILQVVGKIENFIKIKQILQEYLPKLLNETKQRYQKGLQKINTTLQLEQFQSFMKKINKFGIFEYPYYEIISVPIDHFVSNKEKVFSLIRIINKKRADYQGKSHHRIKIPLVYNGTGQSFSKFLKTIAQYQQNFNTQGLRFHIYFLPRHDNNVLLGLGAYLSHKDPWYCNFIYSIYKQKTLYPHIDAYKLTKDLFPYYLYSKNLQFYLRQAKYSMMVQVFKCTIKKEQIQQEQVIYMASFCIMGLFCEAKIIKMNKQKQKGKQQRYQNKELIEVINQKIKKTNIMNLNLQIQCVEPLTNLVRVKKQQNIRIQDLQICNISHEYFMGKCPSSSSPTLQISILTETNGKIFRKQMNKSQNFKQNRSLNQISQAFKDLFICRTIKNIKIQNASLGKNNGLKIVIDGRVIGGVQKIYIEPAVSLNQNMITLPIRCFLPVS